MATTTNQTPEAKAQASIAAGDELFGKNKFDNARKSYDEALTTLGGAHGWLSPTLVDVLGKLVESIYQKGAQNSTDSRKDIGKYLKMLLTIKQRQHGIRSAEVIPVLEQLVIFYDFDGAHMLAVEVLQRIDDIKGSLEVGQAG
ncbi:MAG: hypothetical protein SGJ27_26930 [Candidatus Melainabacteria bacterium]|nr:hypothetical protein [Candidatus Melainabacteria bacterium]